MLLTEIIKFVKELKTSSISREHREFLIDKLTFAEKEISQLRKEVDHLRAKSEQDAIKLAAYAASKEFLEYKGCLWKRDVSGNMSDVPYCFGCKMPMSSFPPGDGQFVCDPCKRFTDFTAHDLPHIVDELNKLS